MHGRFGCIGRSHALLLGAELHRPDVVLLRPGARPGATLFLCFKHQLGGAKNNTDFI